MDRIAAAFAKRLGDRIRYGKVVTQIRRLGEARARVVYRDRRTGAESAIEADFVVVTLPLKVLGAVASDFSPRHKAAIAEATYMPAAKVAFDARRRFWEEDEHIYGGISWTTQDITQLWYPSTGMHAPGGILVGAYIWTASIGEAFARLSLAERLERALGQGEKLHPTYPHRHAPRRLDLLGKDTFLGRRVVRMDAGSATLRLSGAAGAGRPAVSGGRALELSHGLAGRGGPVCSRNDQAYRRALGNNGTAGTAAAFRRTRVRHEDFTETLSRQRKSAYVTSIQRMGGGGYRPRSRSRHVRRQDQASAYQEHGCRFSLPDRIHGSGVRGRAIRSTVSWRS